MRDKICIHELSHNETSMTAYDDMGQLPLRQVADWLFLLPQIVDKRVETATHRYLNR